MWSKSTICQVKQQTIQLPLSGRSQKVMEKLSPCVQYTVGKWDSGTVDRNEENQRCFYEKIENSVGERKGVSVCHYCN